MSSASKGLRRAGIGGLSALLAATAMTGLASTAQAAFATSGGQVGLIDQAKDVAATQGATLVRPGASDQALGDVRLLIPNSFKSGDVIDLAVFDRTATEFRSGGTNSDAAHSFSFTGTPKAEAAGPFSGAAVDATHPIVNISATNDGVAGNNLDNTEDAPAEWAKHGADLNDASLPANNKPAPTPLLTASLISSTTALGQSGVKDIVRLTFNNTADEHNDPAGKWSIAVTGLQATLGAEVSPGELRIVPFAYDSSNATPSYANASALFGNKIDDPSTPAYDATIATYTVPAYVSPVTFSVASPQDIVADNTAQNIGNITIAETNNYSLQAGTYTLHIAGDAGAVIANQTGDANLKVTVAGASGESIGAIAAWAPGDDELSFTLTQSDVDAANKNKATITIAGLQLRTGDDGSVEYSLTGGSIGGANSNGDSAFLVTAGTSDEIPAGRTADAAPPVAPALGVAADSQFVGTVNQTDISAAGALATLTAGGFATPTADRIGGSDRYATAAKIAEDVCGTSGDTADDEEAGCDVVLASGENFPDALSSGYLAEARAGAILLTKKNGVPAATMNALRNLGTSTVYIVGGTNAISSAVEAKLKSTPQYYQGGHKTNGQGNLQVVRLGGADRYATNRVVNEYAAAVSLSDNPVGRTQPKAGESSKLTAIVATGDDFADAMTVGPATQNDLPLILTKRGSLSPDAAAQFANLDIEHAVVAGGTSAVSASVESAINTAGVTTYRIGGANRVDTAALFANWEIAPWAATPGVNDGVGGLGFDPYPNDQNNQRAFLANDGSYADALTAGPIAGRYQAGAPILLTKQASLSPETQKWLQDQAAGYNRVTALGLGAAVSTGALNAATNAVSGK